MKREGEEREEKMDERRRRGEKRENGRMGEGFLLSPGECGRGEGEERRESKSR
jgi:hypothetical protein